MNKHEITFGETILSVPDAPLRNRPSAVAEDATEAIARICGQWPRPGADMGEPRKIKDIRIVRMMIDISRMNDEGQLDPITPSDKAAKIAGYGRQLRTGDFLSRAYQQYEKGTEHRVFPITASPFVNGNYVGDQLRGLSREEALAWMPRRNNPAVGILVVPPNWPPDEFMLLVTEYRLKAATAHDQAEMNRLGYLRPDSPEVRGLKRRAENLVEGTKPIKKLLK